MVANPARGLERLPARPAAPRGRHGALCRMGRGAARQAGLRRLSGGLRFHLDVLVHDALRRALAVRLGRARRQDAGLRADRAALSQDRQGGLPGRMDGSAAAHPRGARRCDGTGRAVLQHAGDAARARSGAGGAPARRGSQRKRALTSTKPGLIAILRRVKRGGMSLAGRRSHLAPARL
ncbi:conserved hypothetical protein [Cupriavidus phytorum]|uniref:Uncharacterized protein n=1 Tax=Cupriavidus taiwanensis TaxID=164546 RepID=A0A375B900_9BURK|nr:conserved hypothetical protein [Cupriavidus taiwanensis]